MPMKALPFLLLLLVPGIDRAQTKPYSHSKNPATKSNIAILSECDKSTEKIGVGDTCYVTTNNLVIRARPVTNSSTPTSLQRNAKVVVREVTNRQWILIDYYDQDVGVEGYVLRQYVSRRKAD